MFQKILQKIYQLMLNSNLHSSNNTSCTLSISRSDTGHNGFSVGQRLIGNGINAISQTSNLALDVSLNRSGVGRQICNIYIRCFCDI